ncbi:hypothetical protein [Streptomyces brevispora]|uniref:hypothetical protein n=1 Tax=Streptomyces brevispora TaxID=887462 RepID=UPI0035DE9E76
MRAELGEPVVAWPHAAAIGAHEDGDGEQLEAIRFGEVAHDHEAFPFEASDSNRQVIDHLDLLAPRDRTASAAVDRFGDRR